MTRIHYILLIFVCGWTLEQFPPFAVVTSAATEPGAPAVPSPFVPLSSPVSVVCYACAGGKGPSPLSPPRTSSQALAGGDHSPGSHRAKAEAHGGRGCVRERKYDQPSNYFSKTVLAPGGWGANPTPVWWLLYSA